MCLPGMIRMCTGALGSMSLKASTESSRYTMSPGMSPLAMPQNRQSATMRSPPVNFRQSSCGQNARTVPSSTLSGTRCSHAP